MFETSKNTSIQEASEFLCKKKKGAEQGADNVRRHAEYKGIVVQKQGSEVCEQQTWVAKRPKRLALDRQVRRTRAFAKIPGEMKYQWEVESFSKPKDWTLLKSAFK